MNEGLSSGYTTSVTVIDVILMVVLVLNDLSASLSLPLSLYQCERGDESVF